MAAPELDERLERYASVAVNVGANVGEGQNLFIGARLEHAPLVRALARQGYAAGARYVDVLYVDQHVRRAQIELGPDEMLDHSPQWLVERYEAMAGNAVVGTTGDPEPRPPRRPRRRKGRPRAHEGRRARRDPPAERTHGQLDRRRVPQRRLGAGDVRRAGVERLWQAVAFCTRLDEPDPVAAWREHMDRLERRAKALNELGLDRSPIAGRARSSSSGCSSGHGSAARSSTRSTGAPTSRTCPPRRSSPPPTPGGPKAS